MARLHQIRNQQHPSLRIVLVLRHKDHTAAVEERRGHKLFQRGEDRRIGNLTPVAAAATALHPGSACAAKRVVDFELEPIVHFRPRRAVDHMADPCIQRRQHLVLVLQTRCHIQPVLHMHDPGVVPQLGGLSPRNRDLGPSVSAPGTAIVARVGYDTHAAADASARPAGRAPTARVTRDERVPRPLPLKDLRRGRAAGGGGGGPARCVRAAARVGRLGAGGRVEHLLVLGEEVVGQREDVALKGGLDLLEGGAFGRVALEDVLEKGEEDGVVVDPLGALVGNELDALVGGAKVVLAVVGGVLGVAEEKLAREELEKEAPDRPDVRGGAGAAAALVLLKLGPVVRVGHEEHLGRLDKLGPCVPLGVGRGRRVVEEGLAKVAQDQPDREPASGNELGQLVVDGREVGVGGE